MEGIQGMDIETNNHSTIAGGGYISDSNDEEQSLHNVRGSMLLRQIMKNIHSTICH